MRFSKFKLLRKGVITGLALIITVVGIFAVLNRFHLFSKVTGVVPALVSYLPNKFCDNPAEPLQHNCISFIMPSLKNVVMAVDTSPYQDVSGNVNISGDLKLGSGLAASGDTWLYAKPNNTPPKPGDGNFRSIFYIGNGDQAVAGAAGIYDSWFDTSGEHGGAMIRLFSNGSFGQGQLSLIGGGTTGEIIASTGSVAFTQVVNGVTRTNHVPVERLRITSDGNVGINTFTPGSNMSLTGKILEVNNAIKITNAGNDWADGTITVNSYGYAGLNIVGIGSHARTSNTDYDRKVTIWGVTEFINGHNDLAENYFMPGKIIRGSLVSIDPSTLSSAIAADSAHKNLIGIVSTNPGAVMDADGGFKIGSQTKQQYVNEKAPIALVGTAPTVVTSQNGLISIGDPIGLSSLSGFGTKMIIPGTMVGKALETFQPNDSFCPRVSSLDAVKWPDDNGKNPQKPCFKLPNGVYVGKIMVAVNVSWYNPFVNLTSTNNFHLDLNQLKDTNNNLITNIGAFSELIASQIQAGIIDTKKLIVNGVDIMEKLSTLSQKAESQQKEIEELKKEIQELKQR